MGKGIYSRKFTQFICENCNIKTSSKQVDIPLCRTCKLRAKRLAYRLKCSQYKNDKCELCDLKRNTIDDLDLFDFHHINQENKTFEMGDRIETKDWEIIEKELDNCMMLCAICHRKQHIHKKSEIIIKYTEKIYNIK